MSQANESCSSSLANLGEPKLDLLKIESVTRIVDFRDEFLTQ